MKSRNTVKSSIYCEARPIYLLCSAGPPIASDVTTCSPPSVPNTIPTPPICFLPLLLLLVRVSAEPLGIPLAKHRG